jgi:BirA family biotin operon repressor/biotin-[acetyl-CoA-carboxylase] ligase
MLPNPLLSICPAAQPSISTLGRWTVHEYEVASSTNLLASRLPAWHAVRAETQTAGRGRFQRRWVSDRGGLWLSAVIPMSAKSPALAFLPLSAGLAVCQAMRSFGVSAVRMRWPNDVLVGTRKLAGLLIDQVVPGRLVVGIGINVHNQPEECDATLHGQVARLADLLPAVPPPGMVMRTVLASLETVCTTLEARGAEALLADVNGLWGERRQVQLDLDGPVVTGEFLGVDLTGRLCLLTHDPDSAIQFYEPQSVRLLREIP